MSSENVRLIFLLVILGYFASSRGNPGLRLFNKLRSGLPHFARNDGKFEPLSDGKCVTKPEWLHHEEMFSVFLLKQVRSASP